MIIAGPVDHRAVEIILPQLVNTDRNHIPDRRGQIAALVMDHRRSPAAVGLRERQQAVGDPRTFAVVRLALGAPEEHPVCKRNAAVVGDERRAGLVGGITVVGISVVEIDPRRAIASGFRKIRRTEDLRICLADRGVEGHLGATEILEIGLRQIRRRRRCDHILALHQLHQPGILHLIVVEPPPEIVVVVQIHPGDRTQVLEVALALAPHRLLARMLQRGQQHRRQYRNDRDHHQQFDQRDPRPMGGTPAAVDVRH